ncbi:MAG: polysaccharide biosynthesis/export family protein [Candidatus Hodarchaeota archaeon]
MKRSIQIIMLPMLVFLLNPINLLDQLNQLNQLNRTNQINGINQITNSIAWAQESKNQPTAGSAQPAPISKHPYQILPVEVFEGYVIGQGDLLEVFVWRNELLSREVVVRPDGKISLPLLQDLQAEGLKVLQLRDQIARMLKEYLDNPRVTVIVRQINSYKVSVLGRVASPGVYPITGKTTLVEAISMAGGFTEWANKRKITVITQQGGKKKKIRVNYKKIVSGKAPLQNIILKRGDTIIVP